MSRAFVKESDDDLVAGDLPERPLPVHVNYVTPKGLELLHARVRELGERHEHYKRDADEDSAVAKARELVSVKNAMDGKTLAKVIYKPGKILNLIVK